MVCVESLFIKTPLISFILASGLMSCVEALYVGKNILCASIQLKLIFLKMASYDYPFLSDPLLDISILFNPWTQLISELIVHVTVVL